MTIFDSLKYPLGHPPTNEEVSAIPDNIFSKWFNIFYSPTRAGPLPPVQERYDLLRKMIAEWDEE